MKVRYAGVFFDKETVLLLAQKVNDTRLAKIIDTPHVTFAYMPDVSYRNLYGSDVTFEIIGYGKNGTNEGFKVSLLEACDKIRALYENIAVPHITISISETGKAVNTRYLEFSECNKMIIKGKFGAVDMHDRLKCKKGGLFKMRIKRFG